MQNLRDNKYFKKYSKSMRYHIIFKKRNVNVLEIIIKKSLIVNKLFKKRTAKNETKYDI